MTEFLQIKASPVNIGGCTALGPFARPSIVHVCSFSFKVGEGGEGLARTPHLRLLDPGNKSEADELGCRCSGMGKRNMDMEPISHHIHIQAAKVSGIWRLILK